jgi:hypothetical protein
MRPFEVLLPIRIVICLPLHTPTTIPFLSISVPSSFLSPFDLIKYHKSAEGFDKSTDTAKFGAFIYPQPGNIL